MIRFHKEGNTIIALTILILGAISLLIYSQWPVLWWFWIPVALVMLYLVLQFFRNPVRLIPEKNNQLVYAPADGKICVVEEVEEPEFFKGKRLQVSIFMSPLNVHVNRNPVSGKIAYFKYHPGLYLVAWHPKASTDNERTTVVYDTGNHQILIRQIAGAVARRIRWYVKEGDEVTQGDDMGFIKFGSRVDIFLPLDTEINVKMDEIVKGNQTVIARLK
jgi:phosphatidylserine decarboxylase